MIVRADGRVVKFDALIMALWGDREPARPQNVISVHLPRARHKIARFGVVIETVYGIGYKMGRRKLG
jgi:DNA-binding response OmpR family regulator